MGKHFGGNIITDVLMLKISGKSNQEIADKYNLTVKQIKNLLTRHRIKEERLANGIFPAPKGRPRIRTLTKLQELELENKRLKRELDLLRSFLTAAGRM